MPGVKVTGTPRPKGSMHCIGPRTHRCKSCGTEGVVIHNVQADDPDGTGKEWRDRLIIAGQKLRQANGFTFEGPVSIDVTFVLDRPAAASKRLWPHVIPDVDKLARMLLDALQTAQVIKNDALVVELTARKCYPCDRCGMTKAGAVVHVDLMVDPDALPIEGGH